MENRVSCQSSLRCMGKCAILFFSKLLSEHARRESKYVWANAAVEANTFNCEGECRWLWRQMPLSAQANALDFVRKWHWSRWQMPVDVEANAMVCEGAFGCVGKYYLVWRQMTFVVEATAIMCGGNCF